MEEQNAQQAERKADADRAREQYEAERLRTVHQEAQRSRDLTAGMLLTEAAALLRDGGRAEATYRLQAAMALLNLNDRSMRVGGLLGGW